MGSTAGGGDDEEAKLLGTVWSPFVRKVEWVLRLKGVKYEFVEEDPRNKSSLLLTHNPIHKKVPVFFHNGKPIVESLIIIQYIDETWTHNPLLPRDPLQKATALFWAKFAEEKLGEVAGKILHSKEEQQEEAVTQAKHALEILEGELKGKKFFGGSTIGLVDMVLGWMPTWLEVIEAASSVKVFDSEKYPLIDQWMKAFSELPIIKESEVPSKEELLPTFRIIRQIHLPKDNNGAIANSQ
ncbi:probable glutathione S-transferase [Malania oleifera]|uniref:probable glutathione S-transferase n=1 Tax=Malania oleifera TaxID=397392 RepID=UPI0025AE778A|nr:probable glutathione S-transferase [Malania oleifera]